MFVNWNPLKGPFLAERGGLEKISSISFSPDAMEMDCQNIFTNTNLKIISFEVGIFEKIKPFGFDVIF